MAHPMGECPHCQGKGHFDGYGGPPILCLMCKGLKEVRLATAKETYYHPDEVSGTTVFEDGTRAYWTEGRSSSVKFRRGEEVWWDGQRDESEAYLNTLHTDQYGEVRAMTREEEYELEAERNRES